MTALTLTELEATNLILASSDMMPVTQLTPTTTAEATLAKQQLDSASRAIQGEGWDFNTIYALEVTVEGDGSMLVPATDAALNGTVIRIWFPDNPAYIQRGTKIYDRENNSFTSFTTSAKATVIYQLPWASLPYEAINYITAKAARRFHEYHVGSSDALRSLVQDEQEARRLLLESDMSSGSYSVFDAPDMQVGLGHGNPLVGRASFLGVDPSWTRDAR